VRIIVRHSSYIIVSYHNASIYARYKRNNNIILLLLLLLLFLYVYRGPTGTRRPIKSAFLGVPKTQRMVTVIVLKVSNVIQFCTYYIPIIMILYATLARNFETTDRYSPKRCHILRIAINSNRGTPRYVHSTPSFQIRNFPFKSRRASIFYRCLRIS